MSRWPRDNQDSLIQFYGDPGSGAVESQLVKVSPPFKMNYEGAPVPALLFHTKAASALLAALTKVWNYYGRDQKKIDALGISKTAGTYNKRKIRGSDTKWSNHAYGAAIDINAEENGFNVAGNIPLPMIAAFKSEGARWGGDYKGRKDPMHFEFCDSGEPELSFEGWLKKLGAPSSSAPPPPVVTFPPAPTSSRMINITATVFGGVKDVNRSAYDNHVITDSEFCVALPARLKSPRKKVRVINAVTRKPGIGSVEDIGPWNIDNPYWTRNQRPLSEKQLRDGLRNFSGRLVTNDAGIDLSPALARLIDIDGKGKVDWEFIETTTLSAPADTTITTKTKVVTGVVITSGTAVTAAAATWGIDWFVVGAIAAGTVLIGAVVFSVLRSRSKRA